MTHKTIALFLASLILFSCPKASHKDNRIETKGKEEENTRLLPPSLSFKDRTPHPAPLTHIPPSAAIEGWEKTLTFVDDPKNIPKDLPEINTEYYRVEKNIEGKNRSISIVFGDILKESDTIVNPANSSIEGGGALDGLIHEKALVDGQDLMKEEAINYKKFHRITSFPVGSAMVTFRHGLNSAINTVVFTVGPATRTPSKNDEVLLYSAIYNSLLKASEYHSTSISFPTVSTGVFGFPLEIAAPLYFKAALEFFKDHPTTSIEKVRFIEVDNAKESKVNRIAKSFLELFSK